MVLKIEKGFPKIYFIKLIMVSFVLFNNQKERGYFILIIGSLHSKNNKKIDHFKEIP